MKSGIYLRTGGCRILLVIPPTIIYFSENKRDISQQVAHILNEIGQLAPEEVAELYYELSRRVDRQEQARTILAKYRGRGAGTWSDEPQEYINTVRGADRF